MWDAGWQSTTLLILDWTLRLTMAARIVMMRRRVSTSLAWLVVVLLLPFAGAITYLLVGEVRVGERRRKRSDEATKSLAKRLDAVWEGREYQWKPAEADEERFARLVRAIGGTPALGSNTLELLADSDKTLERIAADVDSAKTSCHFLYYIWQASARTALVVDALCRAAERGVECRVLVDAVGSRPFLASSQARQLREAGVQVVPCLPVSVLRAAFQRLDMRNHRKIAVIDTRVAYTGSQNLTDTTFKESARVGPWVDASVRLEGPAALALDAVFRHDWATDLPDGEGARLAAAELLPKGRSAKESRGVVQVIPSGPGPIPESIHHALVTAIYEAREEIVMTTPYFVLDEASLLALTAAALRGVRVVVIVPKRSDSLLAAAAGRAHYLDLLEAGVTIMRYKPGLLHSKTVRVDNEIALIGTSNFDQRSFYLNYEITLTVYDERFIKQLEALQSGYIANSDELTLAEWKRRPAFKKGLDNVAMMVGPLL